MTDRSRSNPSEGTDDRRDRVARELEGSSMDQSFFRGRSTVGDPETDSSWTGRSPGDVIGDFRLVSLLGRGGMGQVWEAEQVSMGRRMALKLLHTHVQLSEDGVSRFHREAKAGGKLTHPGIVQVHSVGVEEGVHYMIQELVEGSYTLADSLADFRGETELPEGYYEKVGELFAEMAEALAHAHEHGVVHRDIKPSNILIGPDEKPKVADFGLAMVEDQLGLSRTGDFMGTPFYMSPEQAASKRMGIDHRTDIFSLGATFYESLTLTRAFHGDTSQQIVEQILTLDPQDPQKLRSRVPRDLAVICLKAMEKARDQRYQEMAEFAADLRRYLAHEPIKAKRPGVMARVGKWRRRHPVITGSFVVLALFFLVLGSAIADLYSKSEESALMTRTLMKAEADPQRMILQIERLMKATSEVEGGGGDEVARRSPVEILDFMLSSDDENALELCLLFAGPYWKDSGTDPGEVLDLVKRHLPDWDHTSSVLYLALLYQLEGDPAMADRLIQRASPEKLVAEIWRPSTYHPLYELIGDLSEEQDLRPSKEGEADFVASLPESLIHITSVFERFSVDELLERVHALVYDHHLEGDGEWGLPPQPGRSFDLAPDPQERLGNRISRSLRFPWGIKVGYLETEPKEYGVPNKDGWLAMDGNASGMGWYFPRRKRQPDRYRTERRQSFLYQGDLHKGSSLRLLGRTCVYVHGDLNGQVEIGSEHKQGGTLLVGERLNGSARFSYSLRCHVVLRGGLAGELVLESGIAYIYGLHTAPAGEGVDDSAPTWQLQLGEDASAYLVGYTTREEVERITGSGKVALERSDLPVGEHQIGELRVEVRGE